MAFSARSNGSWIANKCLLNMLECFCYDNDFYWPTNCNFLNESFKKKSLSKNIDKDFFSMLIFLG